MMSWHVKIKQDNHIVDISDTKGDDQIFDDHMVSLIEDGKRGIEVLDGLTTQEAIKVLYNCAREIRRTKTNFYINSEKPSKYEDFAEKYSSKDDKYKIIDKILFLSEITSACSLLPKGTVSVSW